MSPDYFGDLNAAYADLEHVAPQLLERLRGDLIPFHASSGQVLFEVDDQCARFPFFLRGCVRVVRPLSSGRQIPLYTLRPGDFCAMAVACALAQTRYAARASAVEDTVGVTIANTLLRTLIELQPAFRESVFRAVAARLKHMTELIEHTANTTVYQRLAELLLRRGRRIHATHQELADELGTAREVVSRALEHFAADGLVRLSRSQLDVVDPDRLAFQHGIEPPSTPSHRDHTIE